MSISGNLRTMELAELLQWLSQAKKTGTLIVDSGAVTKRVYFSQGTIVASGSTEPTEQLGHFLVSRAYINEVELAKAIGMQEETGMLLGKILVTIGAITEDELRDLLMTQTEEILYDLFDWREAEFRFADGDLQDRGIVPLALDVTRIVLHGMQRIDEWKRIREAIPNPLAVPVTVAPLDDAASPLGRRVFEAINDDRTIRELCLETHGGEFPVFQVLFELLRQGQIKLVTPRSPAAPMPAAPPTPSSGSVKVTSAALLEAAEALLGEESFTSALRHLRAARSLDPDNREIGRRVATAEATIQRALRADGLDVAAVPVLERSVEELTSLRLSPEEGFLLTRIDGTHSIESLLKISPMNRLDGELVFFKLFKEGHIRLQAKS